MDIDVDWCLSCQTHIEGPTPYCSLECAGSPHLFYAADDDDLSSFPPTDDDDVLLFHDIEPPSGSSRSRWQGNDEVGIAAWASEIPLGAPAAPHPPAGAAHFSSGTYRPPPPNLLKSSHQIVPPSLCKTLPRTEPGPPSAPITTPPRPSSMRLLSQTNASLGNASDKSAPTDSTLSTPASSHPVPIMFPSRKSTVFDDMYTHVRSWVSPCPAIFVAAEVQQQRYQPPLSRVESIKFVPTTVLPSSKKPAVYYSEAPRGRSRLAPEFAFRDEHPSFRSRGRKPSRAAA